MSKKILLSSLVGLFLVSCTSEFKSLAINTLPEGATIYINGKEQPTKTPFTASVRQQADVAIVAMKPGYRTATKTLTPETSTFCAIMWTKYDERARYLKEDEVTIPMEKIETPREYKPTALPAFTPPARSEADSQVPELRPMPEL